MDKILLREDQLRHEGDYIYSTLENHSSFFQHDLTKSYPPSNYNSWSQKLKILCDKKNVQVYYFIRGRTEINVYPNSWLERWFNAHKTDLLRELKKK